MLFELLVQACTVCAEHDMISHLLTPLGYVVVRFGCLDIHSACMLGSDSELTVGRQTAVESNPCISL